MPVEISGLADDSKKKEKEKRICSKSNFGMLKMGERGVVLKLWVVCS